MTITKYYSIAKTDILEKVTAVWSTALWGVFIGIAMFIFMNLWTAIYSGKVTLEGFTIAQMVWYTAFAEVIVFSTGIDWINDIGDHVRTGIIANTLLKPVNYIGWQFSVVFGNFFYRWIILGIISFVIAYVLVGSIPFSFATLPFVVIAVLGALILNFCISASLGLLAFWFEDVRAFYWVYQKFIFVLGGMLVPIDVYPVWAQGVFKFLPFSFAMYHPAKLFVHFDTRAFITTMIGQLAWIILFVAVLALIYRAGIRKVNIHGG